MLSTTNSRMTNLIEMIAMLTGIGSLLAWLLPTHCLHSLGTLPPLQRAFRQCVEHVQAMVSGCRGGLLALAVPTDCLRSLENLPPFHRAFRQSVGDPEAVSSLYDKVRQQSESNYAFGLQSFYTNVLCWTGQSFINTKNQSTIQMNQIVVTEKKGEILFQKLPACYLGLLKPIKSSAPFKRRTLAGMPREI